MKRLPFRLPEWAPRITWASVEARATWEPRIQAISNAFIIAERELVVRGLRPSALQNIAPDELPALIRELAPKGVTVLPLAQTPRAEGYQSATRAARPGEALDYRCAITGIAHTTSWAQVWAASDNNAIGELLGYPACCRRFFDHVWTQERWIDTTVPMHDDHDTRGPVNMLWRWFGVRPVSHLPCSPTCERSNLMAVHVREVMPTLECDWMNDILSMPVRYTSWRGIAEITTPILRASVPTDALAERFELIYSASADRSQAVRREGRTPLVVRVGDDPAANGFSSQLAMAAAHTRVLAPIKGMAFDTVVDLGCGDGSLLLKIPAKRRIGVESDPKRAEKAIKRLDHCVVGDCTSPLLAAVLKIHKPDLVIAQKDRNPPETLAGYRVLSYSYESGQENATLLS
jgi:hypothetical protein